MIIENPKYEDLKVGDKVTFTYEGIPGEIVAEVYQSRPLTGYGSYLVAAGNALDEEEVSLLRAERETALPTKPYALVVPPEENRSHKYPYILDPGHVGAPPAWVIGGDVVSDWEVRKALEAGWTVAFEGIDE